MDDPSPMHDEIGEHHELHHEELTIPTEETAEQHPDTSELNENNKRTHDQVVIIGEEDEEASGKRLKVKAGSVATAKKVNNDQWDAMFERLKAYKAEHGDCLVPKRYAADPKLGTWVETQRVQYKRLEREVDEASGVEAVTPNKRLNQERLAKLQEIGFAWSAKHVRKSTKAPTAAVQKPRKGPPDDVASRNAARNRLNDAQWEEMYQRLVKYKEKHGNCLVPRKYEEDPRLATWVDSQRALGSRDYRESGQPKGSLQLPEPSEVPVAASMPGDEGKTPEEWAEEMEKSQDLGTGATAEDAAELVATMADEMHTDEEAQNAAVVAAAAAAAAEAVDAPLDDATKVAAAEAAVDAPAEDAAAEDAAKVAMEEDTKMAASQPKRLTKERKEKLDAIGFVWSLRSQRIDQHWDTMFNKLVQYKEKHGDCLVPSRYEEDLKLGKWVETQRYERSKMQRAVSDSESKEEGQAAKTRITNPRLTEERIRRLESIGFEWKVKHKMKRYYDKQWDAMFARLVQFKEANGHTLVPKRYPPDMKLGTWVHTQRIQFKRSMAGAGAKKEADVMSVSDGGTDEEVSYRLTEDRRKRLEEIGFIWSAREGEKPSEQGRAITRNSYDDQWDTNFNKLVAYKEKYGDCLVPKRYKEDTKLGTWVDTQRVQYKKMKKKLEEQGIDPEQVKIEAEASLSGGEGSGSGKPIVGRLTGERIRRLENLGFVWSLRDDWKTHYEELQEYKKEHGHCNVPARYTKNRRLGIWVSAQRQQYKSIKNSSDAKARRSAPLTQERIDLLNKLGFTWTIRSRDSLGESWNQRLEDLKEYKRLHGNCLVPSRYPQNPELGIWVGTQRTQYRLLMKARESGQRISGNSAMNEDRIRQLEEVGFVWALRGGEGKKEAEESYDADAIEQEAMQVAGALASGEHPEGIVGNDENDAILREAISQAEI